MLNHEIRQLIGFVRSSEASMRRCGEHYARTLWQNGGNSSRGHTGAKQGTHFSPNEARRPPNSTEKGGARFVSGEYEQMRRDVLAALRALGVNKTSAERAISKSTGNTVQEWLINAFEALG